MMEKEICEGCEVLLENLTLENRIKELEARVEALEFFVESLKQMLLEKVGLTHSKSVRSFHAIH